MDYIKVYDQSQNLLAVLENANQASYQLKYNDLSVAGFMLPAADPKNIYCHKPCFSIAYHRAHLSKFRILKYGHFSIHDFPPFFY